MVNGPAKSDNTEFPLTSCRTYQSKSPAGKIPLEFIP